MISPKLRLLLIGVFFIFGIIAPFAKLGGYITFAFLATAIVLLLGHFRHGPMLGILMALRKGNITQAEQLLNSIKRPAWLSARYKAYYHFGQSLVASHQQDIESAETHSEKALSIGYLQDKEQGILYYNLARVAYEKDDWKKAKTQLEKLQTLNIEDLHLKQRIEELQDALKDVEN
jgi:tetratricopeptide (TPR) repeat protein